MEENDRRDESDASEILKRDQAIRDLRALVRDRNAEARKAGARLGAFITKYIKEKNTVVRQKADRTLKLLPIARELALGRLGGTGELEGPGKLSIDRASPPDGFDLVGLELAGPVPLWIERAFRALGRFDREIHAEVVRLSGWVEAAQTGKYGEHRAHVKIDLTKTSAVDAYVHSQTVALTNPDGSIDKGRDTESSVRASLDPDNATSWGGTAWWAIVNLTYERLTKGVPDVLTESVAWDLAVHVLLITASDFDPGEVGLAEVPEWDPPGNEFWTARRMILGYWTEKEVPKAKQAIWLWAFRARDQLQYDRQAIPMESLVRIPQPATLIPQPNWREQLRVFGQAFSMKGTRHPELEHMIAVGLEELRPRLLPILVGPGDHLTVRPWGSAGSRPVTMSYGGDALNSPLRTIQIQGQPKRHLVYDAVIFSNESNLELVNAGIDAFTTYAGMAWDALPQPVRMALKVDGYIDPDTTFALESWQHWVLALYALAWTQGAATSIRAERKAPIGANGWFGLDYLIELSAKGGGETAAKIEQSLNRAIPGHGGAAQHGVRIPPDIFAARLTPDLFLASVHAVESLQRFTFEGDPSSPMPIAGPAPALRVVAPRELSMARPATVDTKPRRSTSRTTESPAKPHDRARAKKRRSAVKRPARRTTGKRQPGRDAAPRKPKTDAPTLVRPIPTAQAAKAMGVRTDRLLERLEARKAPLGGTKRIRVASYSDIAACYPEKAKQLREWANEKFPAP